MRRSSKKPVWPHKDKTTLTPHPSGRWCKKILGKLHYFGPIDKPDEALQLYQKIGPDLHAGRTPDIKIRRPNQAGATIADVVNAFLSEKSVAVREGRLKPLTWNEYYQFCQKLVLRFGRSRLVEDLRPEDFRGLRAQFATDYGTCRLAKAIVVVRMAFKWAADEREIERPVYFGSTFKPPAREQFRKERATRGPRLYTAQQLRRLVAAADIQLKAMLLLATNCGLGLTDCAKLTRGALDLDKAWLDYARPKTGVARCAALWPETVAALREAIAQRPEPQASTPADLIFLTKVGLPWIREVVKTTLEGRQKIYLINEIIPAFNQIRTRAGFNKLDEEGKTIDPLTLTFYDLRHTFRTIADQVRDQHAIHRIMGHSLPGMSDVYVEAIGADRIKAVTDHVRRWYLGEPASKETSDAAGTATTTTPGNAPQLRLVS